MPDSLGLRWSRRAEWKAQERISQQEYCGRSRRATRRTKILSLFSNTRNRRRPGFDHSPPIQSASQEFLFLCSLNHTNARRKSKSGRVGEPIWDESRNYCSIVRSITRDLVKRNHKRVRRNFEKILSWLWRLCMFYVRVYMPTWKIIKSFVRRRRNRNGSKGERETPSLPDPPESIIYLFSASFPAYTLGEPFSKKGAQTIFHVPLMMHFYVYFETRIEPSWFTLEFVLTWGWSACTDSLALCSCKWLPKF